MNITLPDLDTEQADALAQLTAEYNTAATTSLTSEEYCALVLIGSINSRKIQNIDRRGVQLIEAAKTLPDAKRLDFTNQTVALLQQIADQP